MELEEIALLTREEIVKEINKKYPYPEEPINPGEWDHVFHERVAAQSYIKRYQIEALLDGKLTVDQIVEQQPAEDEEEFGSNRPLFENALKELKEGGDREEIIDKTMEWLELI